LHIFRHLAIYLMILFKKQLFDLEVKGQGPTNVITVCLMVMHPHIKYN
jgi:hypothetical protein